MNQNRHDSNRSLRVAGWLALAMLLPLAACNQVAAPVPSGPDEAALAALTPEGAEAAVAPQGGAPAADAGGAQDAPAADNPVDQGNAPVPSAPDAVVTPAPSGAGAAAGGEVAAGVMTQVALMGLDPEAAAPLLTQAAEDALLGASAGGAGVAEPFGAAEGDEAFRATQEALSLQNNIANVDALLTSMEPLATFTPPASAPKMDGRLLYLRNGRFFVKGADGSGGLRLETEDEDMPSVWSPPDDPGRAWVSPDKKLVGFLAGVDAAVWVMDVDGDNNRQIFGNVLPDERHDVTMGDGSRAVKLLPGTDYTLVYTPGGNNAISVLVDNNEYSISGEGRVRFVHAINGQAQNRVMYRVDGQSVGGPVRYGRATAEERFGTGGLALEVVDESGSRLSAFPGLNVGEKEVKTYFIWGQGSQLQAQEVLYEPGTRPTSGRSRVRFFNGGASAVEPTLDGRTLPTGSLAPGEISPYVEVEGTLSQDAREDFEISIYGLRPGEDPITWAPSNDRFAFLAGPTGVMDLYIADLDGEVTQLTQDELRETNPAWSPDGRSLAWVAVDESFGSVQVWALSGLNGTPRPVDMAPVRTVLGADANAKVAIPDGIEWADDDTLFFYPKVGADSAGIWAYDAPSGQLRQVWANLVDDPHYSTEAKAWTFHDEETGAISVLQLDGSSEIIVPSNGFYPEWSPDGRTLTYGEGDPLSSEGWRLRAIDADGGNDRVLTDRLPLLQESPPVPGPNVKRFWVGDDTLIFSRVGRDYGKKDRAGVVGQVEAGNDIENLYSVSLDGSAGPRLHTDLMKVFYMRDVTPSPDGDELAFIAFAYNSAGQQLFAVPAEGGKPVKIDGPVRWFAWVD